MNMTCYDICHSHFPFLLFGSRQVTFYIAGTLLRCNHPPFYQYSPAYTGHNRKSGRMSSRRPLRDPQYS